MHAYIATSTALLVLFVSPAQAQSFRSPEPGESVTVSLTHNDPDGLIHIGDTVAWSLSIAFEGFVEYSSVARGMNASVLATNPTLVSSSHLYSKSFPNGGFYGGNSDGLGGISTIGFTNTRLIEAFGELADNSNPFVVGSFQTTATGPGDLTYTLILGEENDAFVTIEKSLFEVVEFDLHQITLEIDTLTIIPSPGAIALFAMAIPFVFFGRRHR